MSASPAMMFGAAVSYTRCCLACKVHQAAVRSNSKCRIRDNKYSEPIEKGFAGREEYGVGNNIMVIVVVVYLYEKRETFDDWSTTAVADCRFHLTHIILNSLHPNRFFFFFRR